MWTLCLFALLTVVASDTERSGCVYYERSSGSYSFKSGVDSAAVACATLVDEISTTGSGSVFVDLSVRLKHNCSQCTCTSCNKSSPRALQGTYKV